MVDNNNKKNTENTNSEIGQTNFLIQENKRGSI